MFTRESDKRPDRKEHECHICDAPATVPCSNCGEYMCGICECDDGFCDLCDQFRKPKQVTGKE